MRSLTSLFATLSLVAFVAGFQVQDVEGVHAVDMSAQLVDEDDGIDGKCGRCGDGACVAACGENALNCPQDCGGVDS